MKTSYLDGKIVAIFPSNMGAYLTHGKKLILETKEITLCSEFEGFEGIRS